MMKNNRTSQRTNKKISDAGVLTGIAQFQTTPGSRALLLSGLSTLSFQSSFTSFGGQTRIATAKEAIIAKTKAVFHPSVALMKASETNKAITNAWNKFIDALEINRLRLFVQKIPSSIRNNLTQHKTFVNNYLECLVETVKK